MDAAIRGMDEVEFHICEDALLSDDLITIFQILLLPEADFEKLLGEQKSPNNDETTLFTLGVEYLDDSDWSEMVLLACIEASLLQILFEKYP